MATRAKTGGRKAGTPNKSTAEVKALAAGYAPAALKELARLAIKAQSEQARVAACNAILDRAYGKPTQTIAGDPDGAPLTMQLVSDLDRAKAVASLVAKVKR